MTTINKLTKVSAADSSQTFVVHDNNRARQMPIDVAKVYFQQGVASSRELGLLQGDVSRLRNTDFVNLRNEIQDVTVSFDVLSSLVEGLGGKIDQVFNPDDGSSEIRISEEISYNFDSDEVSCSQDDQSWLGKPNRRFKAIYLKNSPQSTSDANHKNTRKMTPQEIEAAKKLAGLINVFKWKEGGDRLHCGPTVQDVIQVFKDCGLKPFDYSFICYDKWEAKPEHAQEAGEIYSFKKEELCMWITRGLHERIKLLESK